MTRLTQPTSQYSPHLPDAHKRRISGMWTTPEPRVVEPRTYVCNYCTDKVGPKEGYAMNIPGCFILICSNCNRPTFFEGERQSPAPPYGADVLHAPEKITKLYDEARNCMQVEAYTCAALALRSLIAHVATERGADPKLPFQACVKFLVSSGHAPANSESWITNIKDLGTEATHDLAIIAADQAKEALDFTEALLKFIYEYPGRQSSRHGAAASERPA